MTIRVNDQKDLVEKVKGLFKNYDDIEVISGELASLGFLRTGGKSDIIAMENTGLEVYVHINLEEDGKIQKYEILTFDEIKKVLE
ncbi:MAG: hypothetical protein JXQ82_08040 [Methanomicrobiaceae archaeon]|nr:hypothetical protein [Methanomicrobiaceae archaeon]